MNDTQIFARPAPPSSRRGHPTDRFLLSPDRLGWAHPGARRGRGARSNAAGRYEPTQTQTEDDGWGSLEEAPPPLRTHITEETPRTIITRNQSPDISFDRSINPYRGCEHGCVYCYARPTHAYMGLSPGLDFETRLFAKPQAARLLTQELANPRYEVRPIAMGTNTDPYQPIERDRRITRAILKVLSAHHHPLTIVTKSALVVRDIDILADMARRNLVKVGLSITTLDKRLARAMEPRAATPKRRLATLRALADAGVPTMVMAAPMIPGLNDSELESILAEAKKAGAQAAGYVLLRMPREIKDLFAEWLEDYAPDRARRVLSLLRQTRGGKDYDARWFVRGRGEGPIASLLAARFVGARKRLGLDAPRAPLDTTQFIRPQPPPPAGGLFG